MTNKYLRRLCLGVVAAAAIVLSHFAPAILAQTGSSQGLTISPFLLERDMQKGDTFNEIIDITNTSSRTLPVDVTVNDFYPQGDQGEPVFVEAGQGDPHYSLSSWLKIISNPQPILQPGQQTSINFSITPPANAENGGHYGALLFTFQGGPAEGSAVSVTQKLGAIILVKLGQGTTAGDINLFKTAKSFYEYPPVTFLTRFNNTGNVHVKPRGGIVITNWFGKKVATVLVNENANNVLPASQRQFTSVWNSTFAFGHYTAEAQLVYDTNGTIATAKTSFWVIPWRATLLFAVILFLLVMLLVWAVKAYNRRLIRKVYRAQQKRDENNKQ